MPGSWYPTFDAYVDAIGANPPQKRPDFLERIKYATIAALPPHLTLGQALAIGAAMGYGWIRREVECFNCERSFALRGRLSPDGDHTYISTRGNYLAWAGGSGAMWPRRFTGPWCPHATMGQCPYGLCGQRPLGMLMGVYSVDWDGTPRRLLVQGPADILGALRHPVRSAAGTVSHSFGPVASCKRAGAVARQGVAPSTWCWGPRPVGYRACAPKAGHRRPEDTNSG